MSWRNEKEHEENQHCVMTWFMRIFLVTLGVLILGAIFSGVVYAANVTLGFGECQNFTLNATNETVTVCAPAEPICENCTCDGCFTGGIVENWLDAGTTGIWTNVSSITVHAPPVCDLTNSTCDPPLTCQDLDCNPLIPNQRVWLYPGDTRTFINILNLTVDVIPCQDPQICPTCPTCETCKTCLNTTTCTGNGVINMFPGDQRNVTDMAFLQLYCFPCQDGYTPGSCNLVSEAVINPNEERRFENIRNLSVTCIPCPTCPLTNSTCLPCKVYEEYQVNVPVTLETIEFYGDGPCNLTALTVSEEKVCLDNREKYCIHSCSDVRTALNLSQTTLNNTKNQLIQTQKREADAIRDRDKIATGVDDMSMLAYSITFIGMVGFGAWFWDQRKPKGINGGKKHG